MDKGGRGVPRPYTGPKRREGRVREGRARLGYLSRGPRVPSCATARVICTVDPRKLSLEKNYQTIPSGIITFANCSSTQTNTSQYIKHCSLLQGQIQKLSVGSSG